jgi:hypothetical protein
VNGSPSLNLPSVVLNCQSPGATTDYIAVFSTSLTKDVSTSGCSYPLCTVSVCHWKEGYSYDFSRWILRKILPFHSDMIVLLPKPPHYSSIPHGGLLYTPMVLCCKNRRTSNHIVPPPSALALRYIIQYILFPLRS